MRKGGGAKQLSKELFSKLSDRAKFKAALKKPTVSTGACDVGGSRGAVANPVPVDLVYGQNLSRVLCQRCIGAFSERILCLILLAEAPLAYGYVAIRSRSAWKSPAQRLKLMRNRREVALRRELRA